MHSGPIPVKEFSILSSKDREAFTIVDPMERKKRMEEEIDSRRGRSFRKDPER